MVAGLPALSAKSVETIKLILEKYDNIVQFECDEAAPPVCDENMVRFNGIGDLGNETFLWHTKERGGRVPGRAGEGRRAKRWLYLIAERLRTGISFLLAGAAIIIGHDGD